ncbi:DUF6257 family protein [Streptomyces sp. NPDC088817]|uniref:DUF6257 family protein n=1 Tax=Streptomyces sp. NPDC088817 TaxID=3365907 RepID=UPI00382AEB68
MADDLTASDFTFGEKARLAGLVARMAKRGLADDGSGRILRDLKRRVERIEDTARRRKHGQ